MASSSSSSSSHLVPRYDQDRLDSIKNKNKWTKPEFGWYKLNIDASVFHENGKLTAGGLIRDFEGKWVVGFTANLITCNSLSASLQAISVGLNLAWNQGLKNVIIESDYGDAVNLIENSNLNHRLDHNIEECRDLMRRDWSVKLNRIDRRKNKCANALARLGRHQIEPLKIMFEENIPKSVNHFYKESVLRTHQDILDSIARKNKYKWLKPEFGWYKLNADASVFYETGGKSTAGGLIRNFEGRWVVGFTANLIPCDSLSAELQAISIGLNLAWNQGLKKVIIESDCEEAVNLIENSDSNHKLGFIIEGCRSLMRLDWSVKLNHIDRRMNKIANSLARNGRNQIEPLKIMSVKNIPDIVHNQFLKELF